MGLIIIMIMILIMVLILIMIMIIILIMVLSLPWFSYMHGLEFTLIFQYAFVEEVYR